MSARYTRRGSEPPHKLSTLARRRRMRNETSLAAQGTHTCAHTPPNDKAQAPDVCGEAPHACGQGAQACGRGAEVCARRCETGPASGARSPSRRRGRQSGCQVIAAFVDLVVGEDRAAPDEVVARPRCRCRLVLGEHRDGQAPHDCRNQAPGHGGGDRRGPAAWSGSSRQACPVEETFRNQAFSALSATPGAVSTISSKVASGAAWVSAVLCPESCRVLVLTRIRRANSLCNSPICSRTAFMSPGKRRRRGDGDEQACSNTGRVAKSWGLASHASCPRHATRQCRRRR